MQAVDPTAAHAPEPQALQIMLDVAPTTLEYEPAAQLRQTVDTDAAVPSVDEYLPAAHGVHVDVPAVVYEPGSQPRQNALAVAPIVDEYVPATQLMHTVDTDADVPDTVEYFPAAHNVHVEEPAVAYEPATQPMHVSELVADKDVE